MPDAARGPQARAVRFRSRTHKSSFGIDVDFLRVAKGGFFLMKKPLERVLSVYTNSETAIDRKCGSRAFKASYCLSAASEYGSTFSLPVYGSNVTRTTDLSG